ncbi:unnamed protein product, partial [Prorocentrum cordatum]
EGVAEPRRGGAPSRHCRRGRARGAMATVAGMGATRSTLLRSWKLRRGLRLELHLTPDVLSHPPGGAGCCDALVNPANEALVGTKLPYFPMPVEPPAGLRTTDWCAMEAGPNMFYSMQ